MKSKYFAAFAAFLHLTTFCGWNTEIPSALMMLVSTLIALIEKRDSLE